LPQIVELAERYGAVTIVDDSHGTGVMGKTGRGTIEHFGLEGKIDILTGTLGKALGGAAGDSSPVAGARRHVDSAVAHAAVLQRAAGRPSRPARSRRSNCSRRSRSWSMRSAKHALFPRRLTRLGSRRWKARARSSRSSSATPRSRSR